MRVGYRDELRKFTQDVLIMSDYVQEMMQTAVDALLNVNLADAEAVLHKIDQVEELRAKTEAAAFSLLALEAPVAGDLRRVVSGIHIVESLARMGALSVHVAKLARRRHPEPVVPAELNGYVSEMARLAVSSCSKIHDILVSMDVEKALELAIDDDAIDDIHHHLFQLTTQREWEHPVYTAVDITLLSRFLERFSDHAVDIAARVVYMDTGMQPEEYEIAQRSQEQQSTLREQFSEISRRYSDIYDDETN